MSNPPTRLLLLAVAATLCSTFCSTLLAEQTPGNPAIAALKPIAQSNRVAAGADLAPQAQLSGHIPGWVTADRQTTAAVDLSAPLHLSVVLQRDPTVQAAFEKLLADQQTPASPLFHQWLTPQQIGDLFGPTPSDVAAVTGWLASQGLSVESVAPSRVILEVSGSTARVAAAFHTGFGYFLYNNQPQLSAISEPSIPAALAPLIRSISGLTDTPIVPMSHVGLGGHNDSTGAHPLLTTSNGSHFVTPNDFAVIYDIKSVYSGGNTGAKIGAKAQHVAIIGRSRVSTTDISEYETNTGVAANQPNVIIPTGGIDPGAVCTFANASTCATSSDQDEATLDVDRVIGTAPGATVDLVIATNASGGIYLAASYNVNTLLDPVMTLSFGACENSNGQSGVNLWDTLFSTAAGEGISVFVASGDSGAAGCEPYNATPTVFPQVASINYICASSYATCAGGTEFNDTASPSTYWSSTNSSTYADQSALSYIPEGAWNEPTSLNSNNQTIYVASSTGGGASKYITKPTWQTGTNVPADGARDTPDIALSSASHDGYYACLDYALALSTENCTSAGGGWFFYFGGTSAAAPGMAGITALLNTAAGKSQGNLNPLLYRLAASAPSAFHDATVASSGVSSCSTATPSICNNSTPSATGLTGGLAGFALTAGYDEATGLGSLDVANFIPDYIAAANSGFLLSGPSTTLSFTSGATSGNTASITISSPTTFAGLVTLTCSITSSSAAYPPSCLIAPTSVTLTAGGSSTAIVTITSTTAHARPSQSGAASLQWSTGGGAVLAMLLCLLPVRRRRSLPSLLAFGLLAIGLAATSGCSSSSSNPGSSTQLGSSAGSYTVTVIGANSATSTVETTNFSLTIN